MEWLVKRYQDWIDAAPSANVALMSFELSFKIRECLVSSSPKNVEFACNLSDIEGFSGELPHAIEQDIHAKALIFNITQALCWEATQQMEPIKREKYAVNSVYALKFRHSKYIVSI